MIVLAFSQTRFPERSRGAVSSEVENLKRSGLGFARQSPSSTLGKTEPQT
jgi:hypothetical protein